MPAPETVVIWEPQPRQTAFITCPADDVGFGGARGGGKSDGVIGDWISHEEQYGKDAIGLAFRRERTQLVELIERTKTLLSPLGYKWHEQDKYFRGPKGGRLRFSYLESDSDADAYQGHSYTRLYCEEAGTFPNEAPINKLQATLRSGAGVPCQFKCTTNPGGSGHQWVKARYGLSGTPRAVVRLPDFEFVNPFNGKKVSKSRVFIPSRVSDNQFLGDDYVANIAMSGSASLVKAWLEGNWDAVEGAFFDGWNEHRHVIDPFDIPIHWLRFVSMDWGFASPFSIGWWAVASDDTLVPGNGPPALGRGLVRIPRGAMVRYREWYGVGGARLTAEEVAAGILERERDGGDTRGHDPWDFSHARIAYGVLDPSAFAEAGGPSLAERMAKAGVRFNPADNTRVRVGGAISGWDQMRSRLKGDDKGDPMVFTFRDCIHSIRTIPVMQHDPDKPEDLDTEQEDHAADEWRYGCMSRPWTRALPSKPEGRRLEVGQGNTLTLDDLYATQPQRDNRI